MNKKWKKKQYNKINKINENKNKYHLKFLN